MKFHLKSKGQAIGVLRCRKYTENAYGCGISFYKYKICFSFYKYKSLLIKKQYLLGCTWFF